MWFDYMDMLAYFNLDTHNSRYVCPQDLKAEHDKLVKRKRRIESKRKLEERLKEASQWEKEYKKEKGRFFGLCINAEDIVITVLQSVSEFVEEAEIMHHCVYSNQFSRRRILLFCLQRIRKETLGNSRTKFGYYAGSSVSRSMQ
ncbi:hypothetical protein BcellWH2_05553 [Bacteroides cellulosilyticus]|uniref:Uncharacterized protein n=2 Tax=Bacteroides cellulosilyticus TaxID=246787 RepID=A0A0P0GJE1_9BACE|nr:hypothetical protein BcellWH2_05553 [Bacteroides cellulosilyticus]